MVLLDVGADDAERCAETVDVGLEDLECGVGGVGGFAEPVAALADVERIVIANTSCLHGVVDFGGWPAGEAAGTAAVTLGGWLSRES